MTVFDILQMSCPHRNTTAHKYHRPICRLAGRSVFVGEDMYHNVVEFMYLSVKKRCLRNDVGVCGAAASCRPRFADVRLRSLCPFELNIQFRNMTVRHPAGMHPPHRRRRLKACFGLTSY